MALMTRILEELFRRASEIDNIVLNYLREVKRVMQYPPKAFKSCRGIHFREKSLRYGVQLIKNGKKRLSQGYDERKTAKTGFPPRGKSKNDENRLPATEENQKTLKIGFPNIGKNKKCHWQHFPTLGKTKNLESLLSDFRGSVLFDTSSCWHYSTVHDPRTPPFSCFLHVNGITMPRLP